MQCVILVGGLGTRLGEISRTCPKPMLPVGGRPFVERLIENAARFGFSEFLLLAGHHSDVVRRHFATGAYDTPGRTVNVKVLVEPEPRGTGGALRFAADHLQAKFLMLNGDAFFDFNWLDLVAAPMPAEVVGWIGLRQMADASRFGIVTTDETGRMLQMLERPEAPGPGMINGGVYWLNRNIIDLIPADEAVSIERTVFPALVSRKALYARAYDGMFVDIGVPDDYQRAQTMPLSQRPAVFFDRDGVLNHDAGYTHRREDFRWIDGAVEAIKAVNDRGMFAFVVTNQAGVARGYYSEDDVQALHQWMSEQLALQGAHIDDFRYCPHHPDAGRGAYRASCSWRKPGPGMLKDLLAHWPVDLARSCLVGDKPSDLEAAEGAGVEALHFQGGNLHAFIEARLEAGSGKR
ncbi:MAG: HAD-IIIA family hydrolase [Pseudomonadota bacterium]